MDRNKRRVTYVTGANSTLSGYGMNEGKKRVIQNLYTFINNLSTVIHKSVEKSVENLRIN